MKYNYFLYDAHVVDGVVVRIENVTELVHPNTTNLKFEDTDVVNEIFTRQAITGTMKLIGPEYDIIKDYLDWGLRITSTFAIDIAQNGVEIGTVVFDAEQSINYDKREVVFKVELIDQYSKMFSRWDKRYNIAGGIPGGAVPSYTFNYFKQTFVERVDVSFSNQLVTGYDNGGVVQYDINPNGVLFAASFPGGDPYSNWSVEVSSYTVNSNPNCTTFEFDLSGTATFYRYNRLGTYQGSTAVPPPTTPATAWVLIGAIEAGESWYPIYIDQPTYTLYSANAVADTVPCSWIVPNTYYANSTAIPTNLVVYANALNRVDEVLKYLISSVDGRILYDNSGTATDSFYGFKNFTGESIGGINTPFGDFAMMGLSNFVPDLSGGYPGVQKSNLQTKLWVVLKEFLAELKKMGFYWEIELRSGVPYFRLYYKAQVSLSTNNPFLGNYHGKDYRVHTKNYKWEEAEYYRIINSQVVGNIEFIGTDMYNRFVQSGKTKEVTSGEYFYDSEDISDNGPANYDDESITAIVLFCCNEFAGTYNVRPSTGFLINQKATNGELAWSNVTENLLVEVPFANGYTNGSNITYPYNRLRKRRQPSPIKLPVYGFNDFDTTSEVPINGEAAKIASINYDWNTNEAEMKLKL